MLCSILAKGATGLSGKMLAVQACSPEFDSRTHIKARCDAVALSSVRRWRKVDPCDSVNLVMSVSPTIRERLGREGGGDERTINQAGTSVFQMYVHRLVYTHFQKHTYR